MADEKTVIKQKNIKWRYIALALAAVFVLGLGALIAWNAFSAREADAKLSALSNEMAMLRQQLGELRNVQPQPDAGLTEGGAAPQNGPVSAEDKLNMINDNMNIMRAEVNQLLNDKPRWAVIMSDMANRAEELTKGLKTDQDKCLAIARWIAANISNRPGELTGRHGLDDVYTWYAERAGLCGARAVIMIEMLKLVNIPAKSFNMYDFPVSPGGHTCVQAWYGGAWHFYDVTYAGVFMDGGNVMSFDQIVANPVYALENMVVFEDTLDRSGYGANGLFDENMEPAVSETTDNAARMRATYTLESLTGFGAFHFTDGADTAVIHPVISASGMPYVFGGLDGGWTDMRDQLIAARSPVSQYITYALKGGNKIKSDYSFTELTPGTRYYLKYYIYEVQMPGSRFYAVPDGAEIISGQELILDENTTEWTIELFIDYDAAAVGEGAFIDMIEIGTLG